MSTQDRVIAIFQGLLARRERPAAGVTADSQLYTGGLNLDSLEVAELSALLDQEFGRDPFTDGEIPETVGQIVRYYEP